MQLNEADEGTVELVLGEVLNNVVEHAYGPGASGRIEMECALVGSALRFCVRDEGKALPGLHLPCGRAPEVDRPLEELPEGGFGWFLVHSLARDLSYHRDTQHNILKFSIFLGDAARA